MKISFTEAAKNCDAAQDSLEKLTLKRDTEISKIHAKYNPDIFTAENDLRNAKKVLQKLVTPVVKKVVSKKATANE